MWWPRCAPPAPATPNRRNPQRRIQSGVEVPAGAGVTIAEATGSGMISALRLGLPQPTDRLLTGLRLQIEFDGQTMVDSPLGEFFGAGLGANDVRSLMFATTPQPGGSLSLSGWWPMPFARSAHITLVNTTGDPVPGIDSDVVTTPTPSGRPRWPAAAPATSPPARMPDQRPSVRTGCSPTNMAMANSSASATPSACSRIKTSFGDDAPYFLEGAERGYTDGSASPQWYGTGTEDLYEGGWYFKNGTRYSDPLTGQPDQRTATGGCADYCVAVYRLMLADAIGYHSAIRFGIEHGKRNMVQPDYSSTAFLYTQPNETTIPGDEVNPGDPVGRFLHGYTDTDADDRVLISQYEGEDDTRTIAGLVPPPPLRSHSTSTSIRTITACWCAARRTRQSATSQQMSPSTGYLQEAGFSPAATTPTAGSTTLTSCPSPSPQAKPSSRSAHTDPRQPALDRRPLSHRHTGREKLMG